MGKPGPAIQGHRSLNKIGLRSDTRGSETSQYPEEEKTIVIP